MHTGTLKEFLLPLISVCAEFIRNIEEGYLGNAWIRIINCHLREIKINKSDSWLLVMGKSVHITCNTLSLIIGNPKE